MADVVLSPFRFDSYFIEESEFTRNSSFESHEVPLDFMLEGKLKIYPEDMKAEILLSACLFMDDSTKDEDAPFTLRIDLKGIFSGKSETLTLEQFTELCKHNAPAILFPFLRSTVADMTRSFVQQPLLLPLINLQNMAFEEQREE